MNVLVRVCVFACMWVCVRKWYVCEKDVYYPLLEYGYRNIRDCLECWPAPLTLIDMGRLCYYAAAYLKLANWEIQGLLCLHTIFFLESIEILPLCIHIFCDLWNLNSSPQTYSKRFYLLNLLYVTGLWFLMDKALNGNNFIKTVINE